MAKFFGVYCVKAEGAAPVLCEVDGGVCYEAHTTIAKAQESADRGNEQVRWNNETYNRTSEAKYIVQPIPVGVRVFNADTDCEDVCSMSPGNSHIYPLAMYTNPHTGVSYSAQQWDAAGWTDIEGSLIRVP